MICLLAYLAYRRREKMLLTAVIPFLCLVAPSAIRRTIGALQDFKTRSKWAERYSGFLAPFITFTFIPFLLVIALSIFVPLIERRTFLIYVPFVLALISAGAMKLLRRRAWAGPVLVVLIALHAGSVSYFQSFPTDTRDYRGLALRIAPGIEENDLLFVYNKNWITTPIFYYLDWKKNHFVAESFSAEVRRSAPKRVWVLLLGPQGETRPMRQALNEFRLQSQFSARRARALLYVRNGR